jgi:hypothetical protein
VKGDAVLLATLAQDSLTEVPITLTTDHAPGTGMATVPIGETVKLTSRAWAASVLLLLTTANGTSTTFLVPSHEGVSPGENASVSENAAKAGAAAAVEITGTDHAAVRTSVQRLGPRAPVVADSDALVSLFTVLRWRILKLRHEGRRDHSGLGPGRAD